MGRDTSASVDVGPGPEMARDVAAGVDRSPEPEIGRDAASADPSSGPEIVRDATSVDAPAPAIVRDAARMDVSPDAAGAVDAAIPKDCIPGQRRCQGRSRQRCSNDGQWLDEASCPFLCRPDACAGQCSPGAVRCAGQQFAVELCSVDGMWAAGEACPLGCTGGVCHICGPGDRHCVDSQQVQECGANGQWQASTTCGENQECAADACRCTAECPTTVVAEAPAGLRELTGANHQLFFHDGKTLWQVGVAATPAAQPSRLADGAILGPLAARAGSDQNPEVYWCRGSEVMRNHEPFDGRGCGHLRVAGSFLYSVTDAGYARRSLADPALTPLDLGAYTALAVESDFLYVGERARIATEITKRRFSDPNARTLLFSGVVPPVQHMEADAYHVYLTMGNQLRRVATAGGNADVLAEQESRQLVHVVVGDGDIFWTSNALDEMRTSCLDTDVYHRSKELGPIHRLTTGFPGFCATGLVRLGQTLYLGMSTSPLGDGPGKIVRVD